MEDIATLSYALGSEPHHPNMIMVGGHRGWLDREIEIPDRKWMRSQHKKISNMSDKLPS